jgi:hypothetical protein
MKIHANVISKNNIIANFHFNLIQFTFLQLNVKSNFFKLIENKLNMSLIFLHVLGKKWDVINVTNHEII